ncbi:hypothetical protein MKS88_005171 [Plasmodium brasilianum]|uniref:Uncharacterized protein n=1 Tax=Plasmodium brasilianum TaxID=5824 RepID=A0ACB9Y4B4_PLABR|nr:hypothetical protein MKS88_005171 [Plasmodium brasilianum]
MKISRLLIFIVSLILCCLYNKNLVSVYCDSTADDVYLSTLKELNLSKEFINIFSDKNVRGTIEKYITEEHLKYYISDIRKCENYVIKTLEKLLVREYPSTIGKKELLIKNDLLKFLSVLFTKHEKIVRKFFDDFSSTAFDVGEKYRNLENKFSEECTNIENLKKTYSLVFSEVNYSLSSTKPTKDEDINNEGVTSTSSTTSNGSNEGVHFNDIKDDVLSKVATLKSILPKLRNKVVALYNVNYRLNEYKHDIDVNILKYKNRKKMDLTHIKSISSTDVSSTNETSNDTLNSTTGTTANTTASIGSNSVDITADMLNLLEEVTSKLMFSLRMKISSTRDELQKKLTMLERELIELSNEITRLDIEQIIPKLPIYKNKDFLNIESIRGEYRDYVKMIEEGQNNINSSSSSNGNSSNGSSSNGGSSNGGSSSSSDEKNRNGDISTSTNSSWKNNNMIFERTLLLLERHSYWIRDKNALAHTERDDIIEVLKNTLSLVEKLKHMVINESFNLLMTYENLYIEVNKFLYNQRYNAYEFGYMKQWNSVENYRGTKILIDGVERLLRIISVLTGMIKHFKNQNKNISSNSNVNLNRIEGGFNSAEEKIKMLKMELANLMHSPKNLQNIKNNLEKYGHVYKENITKLKIMMNSFYIASGNLQSEIENILRIISNIIYADNLLEELNKIRNVWKKYVKNISKSFKDNNTNKLMDAYKGNKNIVFPQEAGYSKYNIVTEAINKNTLAAPYFKFLYEGVINTFDSLNNENDMKRFFSVIYRSVDIIINIIKDNRKNLKGNYIIKRNEILNLINYREDSRNNIKKIYVKLIDLEGDIIKNLQKLFMNRVNLSKQVENSVEHLREDLFKDKLPPYCNAVESFIKKYFLTMTRWKNFINENREAIPSKLIYKIDAL